MTAAKTYTVADLFFTSWKQLGALAHSRAYTAHQVASSMTPSNNGYGFALIACLRHLRKSPLLVDKINVPQAVDIYNDLKFLREPWYYFPELNHRLLAEKPDDEMARCSFDQFIYADNEFSSVLAADTDQKRLEHLRRLAVTLYAPEPMWFWQTETFDPENVESRAARIDGVSEELLMLVLYTYMHVRMKVMKRCKTLLPAPLKSEADEETQKAKPTGGMWHHIKHQAARTNVFGKFDDLGKHRMYDVLDHLEILCKEQEDKKR